MIGATENKGVAPTKNVRRFVLWFDRPTYVLHFDAIDASTREWAGSAVPHEFQSEAEGVFQSIIRDKWVVDAKALHRAAALIRNELAGTFPDEEIEVSVKTEDRYGE